MPGRIAVVPQDVKRYRTYGVLLCERYGINVWSMCCTVDGRIPANQLRLVVYAIIYRVLNIPGGAGGFPPSKVVIHLHCIFLSSLWTEKKTRNIHLSLCHLAFMFLPWLQWSESLFNGRRWSCIAARGKQNLDPMNEFTEETPLDAMRPRQSWFHRELTGWSWRFILNMPKNSTRKVLLVLLFSNKFQIMWSYIK